MKTVFKASLIGTVAATALAVTVSQAEMMQTPSAGRQVPTLDSDQMKVPEPVQGTRQSDYEGALRFDGRSIHSADTETTASMMSVREAQENLNRFGYDLDVDGILGPKTRSALREFQISTGLPTTGRLNEPTVDALGTQSADEFERAPASIDPSVLEPDPYSIEQPRPEAPR